MSHTPYMNSSNTDTFGTFGENPILYGYVTNSVDTQFYPPSDSKITIGPIHTPMVYAKDLNILEIGSSEKLVMSIQDESSLVLKNDLSNVITSVEGVNSNAIHIQPLDTNTTTKIGHLTTYQSEQSQTLLTTESNGLYWKNPAKLQQSLQAFDKTTLYDTFDICENALQEGTLSVNDSVVIQGLVSVPGMVFIENSVTSRSNMSVVRGSTALKGSVDVLGRSHLQSTMDICGSTVLYSTLSVIGGMHTPNITTASLQVSSITSTGPTSFTNQVSMKDGLNVISGVRLESTLSVYNATSFLSTMNLYGLFHVKSALSVGNGTNLSSQLGIQDTVMLNRCLSISHTLSVGESALWKGSSVDVSSAVITGSSLSVQGSLIVMLPGRVGSSVSIQDNANILGSMEITGPAGQNLLRVGKDYLVKGALSMAKTSTLHKSLRTFGNVQVLKKQLIEFMNTKYVWFNNNGGYMVASREYNYKNEWSITMWVKIVSAVTNLAIVVDTRVSGVTAFLMGVNDLNVDDNWHFYTVTMNGTVANFYKDGNTIPYETRNRDPTGEGYDMLTFYKPTFGMTSTYNGIYVSNISYDEIAIYTTALTLSQISAIFNSGVPQDVRTITGVSPASYYRFETLTASNTIPDLVVSSPARYLQSYLAGSATFTVLSSHNPYVPSGVGTESLYNDGMKTTNAFVSKSLSMAGSVTTNASMVVMDHAAVASNLYVNSTGGATSATTFQNIARLTSTLNTYGSFAEKNILSVSHATTLQSTLSIRGSVLMGSTLHVRQSLTTIPGEARLGDVLSTTFRFDLSNTLDVRGTTRIQSILSVFNTSLFSSKLVTQGRVELKSTLTVEFSMGANGATRLSSGLSVLAMTTFQKHLDVCGSVTNRSTLYVRDSMDVSGNVCANESVDVSSIVQIGSSTLTRSTMNTTHSATFATEVRSDTYRSTTFGKHVTIDASKVLINGNVDIVGTLNTINNLDTILLQDKILRLSVDPSGGQHSDGTLTNHESGVYVNGLPPGMANDLSNTFEKSFTWKCNTLHGSSWSALGKTSSKNTLLPNEPTWQLRGGSFKMANYRDASNGALFTMRINAAQELEVWRSLFVDRRWVHTRVTRFGVTKTVNTPSVMSAFTAVLGDLIQSTTSLSLRITSVTDTLYITKGIIPYYTFTQVQVVSDTNVAYPTSGGVSISMFAADGTGTVPNAPLTTIEGLPPNTLFTKVIARVENQYGVVASLESVISPGKATLDASGPQVVGSITVASSTTVTGLEVIISSYDVGITTLTYTGIVFASKLSTYNTTLITTSTPNVASYVGSGKTPSTADTRSFTITTDISGTALSAGTYYVYYVLYDPLGNRTTNGNSNTPSGPHTIAPPIQYFNNFRSLELAGDTTNNQYSEVLNWAPATTNGVSVSVWIYTKNGNTTSNWVYVIGDRNHPSTGTGAELSLYIGASNMLVTAMASTSHTMSFTPKTLLYNEWHNVTCVYNRNAGISTKSMYFNGPMGASASTPATYSAKSNNVTLSAWIKTSSTANQRYILGYDDGASNRVFRYIKLNGLDEIELEASDSTSIVTPGLTISNGFWHHIVVSIDTSNAARIYFDGSLRATGTVTAKPLTTTNTKYCLCGTVGGGSAFVGYIDDVAIWNTTLTASEIDAIYNVGKPVDLRSTYGNYVSTGSLFAYWRFEDGTILDSTSTGIHMSASSTIYVTSSTDVPAGGGIGMLYWDASLVASFSTPTIPLRDMARQHVSVGRRYEGGAFFNEYFKGSIDELSIFNTVLTSSEVSEIYNNGLPANALNHSRASTNLQGYWQMQDFNGIQYEDKSGFGRHLTVNYSGTKLPQMTSNTPSIAVTVVKTYAPSTWNPLTYAFTPDRTICIISELITSTSSATFRAFSTTTYEQLWTLTTSLSVAVQYHIKHECISNNVFVIAYHNNASSTIYIDRYTFTTSSCLKDTSKSTTMSLGGNAGNTIKVVRLDSTGKYIVASSWSSGSFDSIRGVRYNFDGTVHTTIDWRTFAWNAFNYVIHPIVGTGSGWDLIATTVMYGNNVSSFTLYYIFGSSSTGTMVNYASNMGGGEKIQHFNKAATFANGLVMIQNGYSGSPSFYTPSTYIYVIDTYTGQILTRIDSNQNRSSGFGAMFRNGTLRYMNTGTGTQFEFLNDSFSSTTFFNTFGSLPSYGAIYDIVKDSKYLTVMSSLTPIGSSSSLNLQKTVVFNAVGSKSTRGRIAWTAPSTGFSFAFWAFLVRPTVTSSMRIFTSTDSATFTKNFVRMNVNYTGTADFIRIVNTTATSSNGQADYNLPGGTSDFWNKWHHIVGIWTPTQTEIYIDGLKLTSTISSSARTTTDQVSTFDVTQLFLDEANASPCNGYFSNISFYNIPLSSVQINALFNAGNPPNPYTLDTSGNIQVYLRGDTILNTNQLADSSPNNRHAILSVSDSNYNSLVVDNPNTYRIVQLAASAEPDISAIDLTGAVAAYGLRKMTATYTGPIMRVQRSTDSTLVDVYIDASRNVVKIVRVADNVEIVGSTSFSTWGSTGTLMVTTLYDQTGNNKHLNTPYTSYPTTDTRLSKITFNGTNQGMYISGGVIPASAAQYTMAFAWKSNNILSLQTIVDQGGYPTSTQNTRAGFQIDTTGAINFVAQGNTTTITNALSSNTMYRSILEINASLSKNIQLTLNNQVFKTQTPTVGALNLSSDRFAIGCRATIASEYFNGNLYEIVLFNTNSVNKQSYQMDRIWGLLYS